MNYWCPRPFGFCTSLSDLGYTLLGGICTPNTTTTLIVLVVELYSGIVQAMSGLVTQMSPH